MELDNFDADISERTNYGRATRFAHMYEQKRFLSFIVYHLCFNFLFTRNRRTLIPVPVVLIVCRVH
jgi:hypothetical protein